MKMHVSYEVYVDAWPFICAGSSNEIVAESGTDSHVMDP